MTPPRPRAILFDWDNTLIDSWPVLTESINATRTAFGLPAWTAEEARAGIRLSLRDTFPAWFGDRWPDAKRHYHGHFSSIHLDRLAALPGAEALMAHLAATPLILAVVSNKTGGFLRAEAARLGWDRHFHALVGAQDASADKPDPAPVHLALQGSGIAAGPDVWFIGDADVDIEIARATGCSPVLVGNTPLGHEKPADVPHCPDLSALLRWIKNVC